MARGDHASLKKRRNSRCFGPPELVQGDLGATSTGKGLTDLLRAFSVFCRSQPSTCRQAALACNTRRVPPCNTPRTQNKAHAGAGRGSDSRGKGVDVPT